MSKYLPPVVIPVFLPGKIPETISSTVGQVTVGQFTVGHSLPSGQLQSGQELPSGRFHPACGPAHQRRRGVSSSPYKSGAARSWPLET